MCYCKNSLKTSLINDLQNKSIIIQLRVLGLIGKFITGPWMKILCSNSECKANLEMVPMIKMCTMTLRDTETNFLSNCNIKCLWREAK